MCLCRQQTYYTHDLYVTIPYNFLFRTNYSSRGGLEDDDFDDADDDLSSSFITADNHY